MRLPSAMTPLRIALTLGIMAAAVVVFALWNPWSGYLRARLAKAEATTETTQDTLQGQIETNLGQADVEAAASEVRVIIQDAREATHVLEVEARRDPSGADPLPADRAARLRAHDDELCSLQPTLCSDGADSPAP